MLEPSTPVQFVKGIGPRLAEILAAKGIETVDDLLHYLPFRYEDRLNPRSVAELRAGEMATVIAEVRNSGLFRTRRMPIFQLTVGQGRIRLKCLWFNATYLQGRFQPGQMLALYGKVEADRDGQLQIMQPQFEILGDINEEGGASEAEKKAAASLEIGRIVPIYESTGQGKLTPRWFRRIIRSALENLSPELPDPIPAAVRAHLSLISPRQALWQVHWPEAGESFADLQSSRTPAHIRLIFDELFFIELGLELKRREQKAQTGMAFQINDGVRQAIKKILPFHPTAAQKRVLKEIAPTCRRLIPCGVCCRAMWDRAKRLSLFRRPSSRLKTDIRSRSWRRRRFWHSSIIFRRGEFWRRLDTGSCCSLDRWSRIASATFAAISRRATRIW